MLDVVFDATASRHLPLQLPKCPFHVPALTGVAAANGPSAVRQLARRIKYDLHGLVLLGTEACCDKAVPLSRPEQTEHTPSQTLQRKEKAIKIAAATLQMIALAPPAGARQAGFTIARCIIAHALDYDAGFRAAPCCLTPAP